VSNKHINIRLTVSSSVAVPAAFGYHVTDVKTEVVMVLDFKLGLPLESTLKPGEETGQMFEVIIIGGGPAGLTAAMYVARKQMKAVLISPDLGGQVLATSGVENYMGYQYITGPELSMKFSEQIRQFPIKVLQNEKAINVRQNEDKTFWVQTDSQRELQAQTLILATGKRWRKLNVPGENEYAGRGVAYCAICDAPFFKGLPVAVIGGGNSALTAALDLIKLHSQVTVINFSENWQADSILLERVKDQVTLLAGFRVLEIMGNEKGVTHIKIVPRQGGREQIIPVQGVFVEIGLIPNTELFEGLVKLNEQREILVAGTGQTSRLGIFAAGDCTDVLEKQIIVAAGDGAKTGLAVYRYLMAQELKKV
jgi:NADH-dependent peroxiredoxin subunit F